MLTSQWALNLSVWSWMLVSLCCPMLNIPLQRLTRRANSFNSFGWVEPSERIEIRKTLPTHIVFRGWPARKHWKSKHFWDVIFRFGKFFKTLEIHAKIQHGGDHWFWLWFPYVLTMDFMKMTLKQQIFIGNSCTFEAPRAKREKHLKTKVNAPPQRPSENHQKPLVFLMFCLPCATQKYEKQQFFLGNSCCFWWPAPSGWKPWKNKRFERIGKCIKKGFKNSTKICCFLTFSTKKHPISIDIQAISRRSGGQRKTLWKPTSKRDFHIREIHAENHYKIRQKSFESSFCIKSRSETITPSSIFVALWPHAGNALKTNGNHDFLEFPASARTNR